MTTKKAHISMITSGLLMGLVLSSLDQTVVSTGMPRIVKDLGGLALYGWVFSIYMLVSTTTIPIYGKLADLFGRKKIYLTGLVIFLAGSVLCGLAGNMIELVIFRGIQGLGAGCLMPVAFTIVADIYPIEDRGKFQGLFGSVFALSSIVGPAVGGFIVQYLHWSWIFYINLVLGVPALYIIAVFLHEEIQHCPRSIDWLGTLTFSLGTIATLSALLLPDNIQRGSSHHTAGSPEIVGLYLIGFTLLALFIWIESKVSEPVIPLNLFKIRTIASANIAGFFISAAMFDITTYIPLFAEDVIGVQPSIVSFILTPLMLAVVVSMTIGGRLMKIISYRMILVSCMGVMIVGFLELIHINIHTTNSELIFYMIVTGLGMGAIYPTLGTAVQGTVDIHHIGVATSSSQFSRSIGGAAGVSVFGTILTERTPHKRTGFYSYSLWGSHVSSLHLLQVYSWATND